MTCQRCNGRMFREYGEMVCIACGARVEEGATVEIAIVRPIDRERIRPANSGRKLVPLREVQA